MIEEEELIHYKAPIIVEYLKRVKPYNMAAMQRHNHLEIYYMLSGERYYFIKDTIYHVKKGDLIVIEENELHKTIQVKNALHERVLLVFNKEVLRDMPSVLGNPEIMEGFVQTPVLRLTASEQEFVKELLFNMIKENQLRAKGYDVYVKLLLVELMLFIVRRNETSHDFDAFADLDPLHTKICEIIQYMNKNYMGKITLEDISKKYFMSYHYLSRSFKSVTGFTFIEYLNRLRIDEAQRLLKHTNHNITSIAEKIGYGSVTHFERIFKQMLGISPLKYKKLERKQ